MSDRSRTVAIEFHSDTAEGADVLHAELLALKKRHEGPDIGGNFIVRYFHLSRVGGLK